VAHQQQPVQRRGEHGDHSVGRSVGDGLGRAQMSGARRTRRARRHRRLRAADAASAADAAADANDAMVGGAVARALRARGGAGGGGGLQHCLQRGRRAAREQRGQQRGTACGEAQRVEGGELQGGFAEHEAAAQAEERERQQPVARHRVELLGPLVGPLPRAARGAGGEQAGERRAAVLEVARREREGGAAAAPAARAAARATAGAAGTGWAAAAPRGEADERGDAHGAEAAALVGEGVPPHGVTEQPQHGRLAQRASGARRGCERARERE
jgi:hypothetical protein